MPKLLLSTCSRICRETCQSKVDTSSNNFPDRRTLSQIIFRQTVDFVGG